MIPRMLEVVLKRYCAKFPIVAVTGPRQSGKTTLLKHQFPEYEYVSLENPDLRMLAEEDPYGFLGRYDQHVIFDEIQHVPELFSYLQTKIDEDRLMGQYILSGSHHFTLMERITQSLAGRVALFRLLPFQFSELKSVGLMEADYQDVLFQGFYPPLYDRQLSPDEFFPSYVETYLERDLRNLMAVKDLSRFRTFLKLCAGRIGQVLNLHSIAIECGISSPTAKSWLSLLETSFVVFLLPPYYRNFNKRLTKSPKLYFYDTGLACYLLGIRAAEQVETHFARGALLENLVVAELLKQELHAGKRPEFFYWREKNGREIDLLMESPQGLRVWEIKAGATLNPEFFKSFRYLDRLEGFQAAEKVLVYGGDTPQQWRDVRVLSWSDIG
ncbi:MAG: ATP-binding protein [Bacteroidetes bacterium]|nr:MAG: ATP-binding protein [Bacteroidota bacterium]